MYCVLCNALTNGYHYNTTYVAIALQITLQHIYMPQPLQANTHWLKIPIGRLAIFKQNCSFPNTCKSISSGSLLKTL